MSAGRHDVNAINVRGKNLLLTETSGGTVVHLTPEASPIEDAQSAVPDYYFDTSGGGTTALRSNYDKTALLNPRWAQKTLCGRPWISMASGDGGLLHEFNEEQAFAPTCKRCLSLMDRLFPAPRSADRLALVIQVVTDLVLEHGYAEVQSVPGDQQAALRAGVRKAVRRSSGHGTRTYVHSSVIIFACDAITEQHSAERDRHTREAMNLVMERMMTGGEATPIRPPEWRTSWDAWSVD